MLVEGTRLQLCSLEIQCSGCSYCCCCCCCCKVASVMSDSVRPHRWQPTRLPRPWDSPGKDTGAGCHFLIQYMKVKSESEVAQLCPTLCNPMDCSLPGSSSSMGFSKREYWSGVPLPSPASRLGPSLLLWAWQWSPKPPTHSRVQVYTSQRILLIPCSMGLIAPTSHH